LIDIFIFIIIIIIIFFFFWKNAQQFIYIGLRNDLWILKIGERDTLLRALRSMYINYLQ
jgi:hypothetical protein